MGLWLKIILIVGPLLLGTYVSTVKKITRKTKVIVWIVCLIICISGVSLSVKEKVEKEKESKVINYYQDLIEKQELYHKNLPQDYINEILGEKNPLLKHFFLSGLMEEKGEKAIEQFKKSLSYSKATEEVKIAANILIGDCYYRLSYLKEAEKYYKEALNISKRVKDKSGVLQERAIALCKLGIIYLDLDKPDKALEYFKETLKIDKKIGEVGRVGGASCRIGDTTILYYLYYGYEGIIATALCDIGMIYSNLDKSDKALKYLNKALEIDKLIKHEPGVAAVLFHKGITYGKLDKFDRALDCLKEALEIDIRIGDRLRIEEALSYINFIEEKRLSEENIARIEKRGAQIADYERAVIKAKDLLLARNPDKKKAKIYIAINDDEGWTVYFGEILRDKNQFKVASTYSCPSRSFEKMEAGQNIKFKSKTILQLAKAVKLTLQSIKAEFSEYNVKVFREKNGLITVYLTPKNENPNVILIGGDVKLSVSSDGTEILRTTMLHKSVLEIPFPGEDSRTFHTHVLSDLPTETDVALILLNPQFAPHLIIGQKWMSEIDANGKINFQNVEKNIKTEDFSK